MRKNLLLMIAWIIATLFCSDALAVDIYTVKKGDCLERIARGLEIQTKALYGANLDVIGSNPDLIFPGQNLLIPLEGEVFDNEIEMTRTSPPKVNVTENVVEKKASPPAARLNEKLSIANDWDETVLMTNPSQAYLPENSHLVANTKAEDKLKLEKKQMNIGRNPLGMDAAVFLLVVLVNVVLAGRFFFWFCDKIKKKILSRIIFNENGKAFIGLLKKQSYHQYFCIDGGNFLTIGMTRVGSFVADTFGREFKSRITFNPPVDFKAKIAELGIAEGEIWTLGQREKRDLIQQTCLHLKRFG